MIFYYIYLALLLALMIKQTIYHLAIFQQEHYDMIKYAQNSYRQYRNEVSSILNYGILLLVGSYFLWENNWILISSSFLVILSYISIKPLIIPLKVTKRIIRLIITLIILLAIIIIEGRYVTIPLVSSFCLLIVPWLIILSNLINYPVEKLIKMKFIKQAKKRIDQSKILKIAITGSFGKTSTKNILNSLLNKAFLTLPTPKSYNTPLGIAKTINEYLYDHHEIFIVEMGAFRKKEIAYLTNFIKPDIGILTDVGPQHLSTFKNIETILKTKMELFESANKPRLAIMNFDNPLIRNYAISELKEMRIIGFGIKEEGVDYQAQNIQINKGETTFDLYQRGEVRFNIKTKLIGYHNIYNLIAGIATILEMNQLGYQSSVEEIIKKAYEITNTPHRLSYVKKGLWDIYDDSYNANVIGFTNALEVIKMSSLLKIIITPGIVDAGVEIKKINETVAKTMIEIIDEVYLVENEATRYIKQLFINEGYQKYVIVNSFKNAYQKIKEKYDQKEICLLIENDLPDNFLERR